MEQAPVIISLNFSEISLNYILNHWLQRIGLHLYGSDFCIQPTSFMWFNGIHVRYTSYLLHSGIHCSNREVLSVALCLVPNVSVWSIYLLFCLSFIHLMWLQREHNLSIWSLEVMAHWSMGSCCVLGSMGGKTKKGKQLTVWISEFTFLDDTVKSLIFLLHLIIMIKFCK